MEIVVTGAPEGEVRYQVVVEGTSARAYWRGQDLRDADVRFASDYATVAAIASGRLAAVDALAQGRARVSGRTSSLAHIPPLGDLVPPDVRCSTSF